MEQLYIPKVCIIMAVYNRDFKLIERALNSVLKQDFNDFEIIIVDDGSDFKTGNEILKYAIKNSNKITYLRHKNIGQSLSINKGLLNTQSKYIGFIDSDDEYKINHITECLKHLEPNYDLIASLTENIANDEEDYFVPNKYNINENIFVDDCIVFGTLFGKRNVFNKIKFHDVYSPDSDFFERASKIYKTQKFDLKTYIYHLGSKDGIMTTAKNKRKNCL
jgi:glycosyltransferase involved in cell wall biosynthesis